VLGLEPLVAPLFEVRAIDWDAPDPTLFDALMFTSANAPRLAGEKLAPFTSLPCYCVGSETARAAEEAGLADIRTGPSDAAALLKITAADAMGATLHLCGRDHLELDHPSVRIERRIVYASEPVGSLTPEAAQAIASGALVLVHSPRAGAELARVVPDRQSATVAAISSAAADAAGVGWRARHVAAAPRDEALLELAVKLCQTGAGKWE
jgi:uroporphyrinogen-III synthase